MKWKKADIILCLSIVLLVGISCVIMKISKTEGEVAVITVKGNEYAVCSLSEDRNFEITSDDGKKNVVVIKDGYVYMESADCPDHICVKHKKIKYKGETIACVPNQILIEIKTGEEAEIDVIAR